MHYLERLFSLRGKRALITGASGGIGRVLAEGFSRAGATVGLNGVSIQKLELSRTAVKAAGGKAVMLAGGLNSVTACRELVTSAVAEIGSGIGERSQGRDFNNLVIERVREVRRMIDAAKLYVDLQAAGGLETDSCVEVCKAGARALALGSALHRESDMGAYISLLRQKIAEGMASPETPAPLPQETSATIRPFNDLIASRSFSKNCRHIIEALKAAGAVFMPHSVEKAPSEEQLLSVVIEATGNLQAMESTVNLVAAGGRIVIVGLVKKGLEVKFPGLDFTRKEVAVVGSRASVNCFPEALELLASGKIQYPKVAAEFSMWEAPAVFRKLAKDPAALHEAVLVIE